MRRKFKIASNCLVVKGHKRNLLIDLQHQRLFFLEDSVLEDIERGIDDGLSKSVIEEMFDKEILLPISEDDIPNFISLSEYFVQPNFISNAIIDRSYKSNYDLLHLLRQLEDLLCPFVEIRFFCKVGITYIEHILNFLENSSIESIDICLPFLSKKELQGLIRLKKIHSRIRLISVYSCPNSVDIDLEHILLTTEEIRDDRHCGNVAYQYFSPNIDMVMESLNYNSCLNKKISVDVNGEIKNCPSMAKSFGNIKDTSLREALNKKGFKDFWHIKKDDIKICQDCEFRRICTDCRAYLEEPNNIFSKPLKCGYDPYKGLWGDWQKKPFVDKIIEFYSV